MKNRKYICNIVFKNKTSTSTFASYKPGIRRCDITGEPIVENIEGLIRWDDVHSITTIENPEYDKNSND